MQRLIIYHGNCWDGIGAAWAVANQDPFIKTELVAGFYGEAPPLAKITAETEVWVVDFSYDLATMLALADKAKRLVWVDHHASVEPVARQCAKLWRVNNPKGHEVVFDTTQSGAVLAVKVCYPGKPLPQIIEYIEDYDLWRKALPHTDLIISALDLYPQTVGTINRLVMCPETIEMSLIPEGRVLHRQMEAQVESLAALATPIQLGGTEGLGINLPPVTMPLLNKMGEHLSHRSGSFALLWHQDASGMYQCSLRSQNKQVDVGQLAKQLGGGGHPSSAGFRTRTPCWTTRH